MVKFFTRICFDFNLTALNVLIIEQFVNIRFFVNFFQSHILKGN